MRILLCLLVAAIIGLQPNSSLAADAKVGTSASDRVTPVGGAGGGLTYPLLIDPASGAARVILPAPTPFYGAGITSDTTTNVSNLVATQTTCCGYADIESAPWSTANLFPYKSLYIKVNSTNGTTGSVVFRIQGSYTGGDGTWNDILLPSINQGTAVASPETLQFVTSGTGAPLLGGFKWPLNSVVSAATGAPVWNFPLNAYAWLRVVVMNRSNSTGSGVNYTVKWEGSQ